MSKADLRVDWASAKAATYACENWHYSGCIPRFGSIKLGVWERGDFRGVVIFSRGATPQLGNPYGLNQTECCELTRIALRSHDSQVSRIVAICLRFLRRKCPGMRLVVSFADDRQGHHGGVYQANGWIYAGAAKTQDFKILGKFVHPKTLHNRFGTGGQSIPWLRKNIDSNAERVLGGLKHRYLMPLDPEMRERIAVLSKPYPKRAGSTDSGTPVVQIGGGGATPTSALISEADHE